MTKTQTQTTSRGHEIYSNKTNVRIDELEISLDKRCEYTAQYTASPGSLDPDPKNLGFVRSGIGTGRLKAEKPRERLNNLIINKGYKLYEGQNFLKG